MSAARSAAVPWLAALWVALWGFSVGNVLAGLAVAVAVRLVSPLPQAAGDRPRLDPVRLVVFTAFVAKELVVSSVAVVRIILRRGPVHSGVVEVPLHTDSAALVTIIGNVITLTPGTVTIEASRHPARLTVHFLDLPDDAAAERSVRSIERAVVRAFGPRRRPEPESGR